MSSLTPLGSGLGAWSAERLRTTPPAAEAEAAAWFDAPEAGALQLLHAPAAGEAASPEALTARFLDSLLA